GDRRAAGLLLQGRPGGAPAAAGADQQDGDCRCREHPTGSGHRDAPPYALPEAHRSAGGRVRPRTVPTGYAESGGLSRDMAPEVDCARGAALPPLPARRARRRERTTNMTKTSTQCPPTIPTTPSAARACRPRSPSTASNMSEAPLSTFGWSVKPSLEVMKPSISATR